ncbi:hypothetical protein KUCAC02_015562, partial [Chaenocephalus aceratus]
VQEAWAGKDVINAYLTLIVRTFNQHNDGPAAVIDSYAMTAIWKHTSGRIRECNTFATTLRLIQRHTVIGGMVTENHHWMLVVMYPHEKKTLFLDPLGEGKGNMRVCLQSTRALMRMKGCKVSRQHILWCPGLKICREDLTGESDDLSRLCFYCGVEEQDEEHWVISYCTLQIKKISRNMFPDFINITFALVIATIFGIFSIN